MSVPKEKRTVADSSAISKAYLWLGTVAFFGFLILLPLASWKPTVANALVDEGLSLRERLRSLESRFSHSGLFESWRKHDQARLTRWLSEGNHKVLMGKNHWLFYRPDVETVVGKGPYSIEPHSVARSPQRSPWQPPLPVIHDFAKQLEERGINLILVPIPTKAMVHADQLGAKEVALLPRDWHAVLEELRASGIQVVDLIEHTSFLRQDTHWTPAMMASTAEAIARNIGAITPSPPSIPSETLVGRRSRGDLVEMLGVAEPHLLFAAEVVDLTRYRQNHTTEQEASLVLLGDSFVNIYDDCSLGFAVEGKETSIQAGLASHLEARTGNKVETIASNGGGATTTRKRFSKWLSHGEKFPETVIWVLSARDIFLAETAARRAKVSWEFVELPKGPPPKKAEVREIILTATLREKSHIGDEAEHRSAAYQSATYSAMFDQIEVEYGNYTPEEATVYLWAVKNRKLVPTAHLKPGQRYRLELIPFPKDGPVSTASQLDDFFRIDLPRLFARTIEPAQPNAPLPKK